MRSRRLLIPASAVAVGVVTLLVAVAVTLLAAGCGSSSPRSATAVVATTRSGPIAFARCMRSHGFPGWPDPDRSGLFDKFKLRQLGYSVSRVRAIEQGPCDHVLPDGAGGPPETAEQARARFAAMLSFAGCMRARGFPSFPDPTSQGQLTPEMVAAAGIDLHQPALLRAGLACVPVTHGLLTRAAVERAVNGG
jgi:hypothetical protein